MWLRLVFCVLALGVSSPARAQTLGTLAGTVVDTTGGALPGVSVTLRNTSTGLTRTATSAGDGRFVFAGVPPGPYRLQARLTGFHTLDRGDIRISVGESASLLLTLEVVVS